MFDKIEFLHSVHPNRDMEKTLERNSYRTKLNGTIFKNMNKKTTTKLNEYNEK